MTPRVGAGPKNWRPAGGRSDDRRTVASLPSPQRAFPRHAVDAEVTLRQGGIVVAQGRSRNLSRGGLCALVDRPVASGVALEVSVALVFPSAGVSEPLTLPARVVWCVGYQHGEQVGVSFLPLDAPTTTYLDMFIRFLSDRGDDEPARDR
jgi:hypothetical protein